MKPVKQRNRKYMNSPTDKTLRPLWRKSPFSAIVNNTKGRVFFGSRRSALRAGTCGTPHSRRPMPLRFLRRELPYREQSPSFLRQLLCPRLLTHRIRQTHAGIIYRSLLHRIKTDCPCSPFSFTTAINQCSPPQAISFLPQLPQKANRKV